MLNFDIGLGKRFDNMYFGLGTGVWTGTESESDAIIPIAVDWDAFWGKGRIVPTGKMRLGFGVNTAKDIHIGKETIKMPNYLVTQVMPGIRIGLSRSVDLDLAVGLTGLTSVGGSKGAGGKTNVFLSFGGALNFHKSTNVGPKKTKKPVRSRGLQIVIEGVKSGFSDDDGEYSGYGGALTVTYKFNHNLSAGIGIGTDGVESSIIDGLGLLKIEEGKVVEQYKTVATMNTCPKIFVRGMYSLNKKRFSPFISCDAGLRLYSFDYGYGSEEKSLEDIFDIVGDYPSSALYIEPAVGISIRTTNNSYFDIKVGHSLSPSVSSKHADITDESCCVAAHRASFKVTAPFVSVGFRHTFGIGSKWFK